MYNKQLWLDLVLTILTNIKVFIGVSIPAIIYLWLGRDYDTGLMIGLVMHIGGLEYKIYKMGKSL